MTKKQKPEGYVFGSPTKYKPEFCQRAIDVMQKGGSRREVCLDLSIAYQTFLDWINPAKSNHQPDFMEAVKVGDNLCQAWWEMKGREGTFGEIDGMNATMYQFNMKNRFKEDWRDKQEIVQTTTIVDMTDEDLDKQIKEMGGSDE